jgi:hypothetical protein
MGATPKLPRCIFNMQMAQQPKEQDMNQHIDLLSCVQPEPIQTDVPSSKKNAKSTGVSRRRFLGTSAVAAGGLTFAFTIPFGNDAAAQTMPSEVNAWVVVKPDDSIVIRIARSEMGQGTLTGLSQLVAEELDVNWAKVSAEYPTPATNLARNRVWGNFGTGGQPRHSPKQRLCAQGRRSRAHDAGASSGRCMEGARI